MRDGDEVATGTDPQQLSSTGGAATGGIIAGALTLVAWGGSHLTLKSNRGEIHR